MSLKKNVIANYLGQGWVALMGLVFIPFYIKYLGIEAYGLIGIFALLQAWLSLLDMGMTPTLSREMARFSGGNHSNESIRDLLRSIEIIALGITIIIALTIWLSAEWLATSWIKNENLSVHTITQSLIIMGFVAALRFIEGIYRGSIIGLQRHILFNTINSIMATLRGIGTVGILIWVSPTIEAFFIWQGLVSILTLISLGLVVYKTLPHSTRSSSFSWFSLKSIWKFAGGVFGITLLASFITNVDKLILSGFITLEEFGHYTLAITITSSLGLLYLPIHQTFLPKMTELFSAKKNTELIETYHLGAQLVVVFIGSVALTLIFNSELILNVWMQNNSLTTSVNHLLQLLLIAKLINSVMAMPYELQLVHGWTSLTLKMNAIAALILIPTLYIIVPIYKAEGTAWILIALNTGYVLIGVHFVYQKILQEEKWRWYWKDVLLPIVSPLMVIASIKLILPTPSTTVSQAAFLIFTLSLAFTASILSADKLRIHTFRLFKPSP